MILQNDGSVNKRAINLLAKSYNPLDYSVNLASLLKSVYPSENFDFFSKYDLHKLLNDTILQHYNGEEVLKYKLFQCYLNKKNFVAAFEIRVNNSRVDFLTINGASTSFEIKSELDNLSKLNKQMFDYMLAFEYNYLVVDAKHIKKARGLLPEQFGLWVYKNGKFQKAKKALLNDKMNPEAQLKLLSKKELANFFPYKDKDIVCILNKFDASSINKIFKEALKKRYKSRWDFLVNYEKQILPIDIQFFFNTNIQPRHIY